MTSDAPFPPMGSGTRKPSHHCCREFFEPSPELCFMIDDRGRISQLHHGALSSLAFREDELIGRHFYRLLDRRTRQRVRAALAVFAASGAIDHFEFELIGGDDRPRELVASARAVGRRAAGAWAGARVVLRDLTRRNHFQRQLRQVDRLAATGRVAAGVAHEINNPLQALLMHLAVVEQGLPADFAQRESWARVRESVARVREIVGDLLDLHRGPAARGAETEVNAILEEALGLTSTQFRKAGITVCAQLSTGLREVAVPSRHIYQIVLNLLLNAFSAMKSGGRLLVRTRELPAGGEIVIEVCDAGPGISSDAMPALFEPFQSGDDGRGTGLGLFVTYGLIRDCGGRVQVDSRAHEGTTFRVYLPVASDPA